MTTLDPPSGQGALDKVVPGAGGLSVAANAIEGRIARAWAENIWADTLAT